eukprot:102304_1
MTACIALSILLCIIHSILFDIVTAAPTPQPTVCLTEVKQELNTDTFTNWLQLATETVEDGITFTLSSDSTYCYATLPCINIKGIGVQGISTVYIERTLDVSMWQGITIHVEATTDSMDNLNERGFIETQCDTNPAVTNEMNPGATPTTRYTGCFPLRVSTCSDLTIRFGGYLSGTADAVYITYLAIDYTLHPTSHPTTAPTTITLTPTHNPIQPSSTPSRGPSSSTPTRFPTQHPSISPSFPPSHPPTQSPTHDPSVTPSSTPSTSPIASPSAAPTTPCLPDVSSSSAMWSSSYLSIDINVHNTDNRIEIRLSPTMNQCSDILSDTTIGLVGTEATCEWVQMNTDYISFTIHLDASSTIALHHDIMIKASALHYRCVVDPSGGWGSVSDHVFIAHIEAAETPNLPNIIVSSLPTQIGVCDGLVLDAHLTTNLGGRHGLFLWNVSMNDSDSIDPYEGNYIQIEDDTLQKGATYYIELKVISWFGESNTDSWSVYVSNAATPNVAIYGVSYYQSTNRNLNNLIHISADVLFDDTCLQGSDLELQYHITWTVQQTQNGIQMNTAQLDSLKALLTAQNTIHSQVLSITARELLQAGSIYTFAINVECSGDYECNMDATHELVVDYADIVCKLDTNDIVLQNMDPLHDFNALRMESNGFLFTFDPDSDSKSHLLWNWSCIDDNEMDCGSILTATEDTSKGHMTMDMSQMMMDYNEYRVFTISMSVSDGSNTDRNSCTDSVQLHIWTKNETNITGGTGTDIKSLIVTVTAIANRITQNDKVQLLGNILNYDYEEGGSMQYKWSELNGLLTDDEIETYKETTQETMNLILKDGILRQTKTYSFELNVTQYDDANHIIGKGISSPIEIYVIKEPIMIISDSFTIEPECNYQYKSLQELLNTPYSMALLADGDYLPLSFVFGYTYDDVVHFLHPYALYEAKVSDIYLPLMDAFEIFGNVMDATSATISNTIQCSITLKQYGLCLDFEEDVMDPFIDSDDYVLMTASEVNSFVVQQSNIYLLYLSKYDGNDDECVTQSLVSVLKSLDKVIHDLCDTLDAILLSQTLTLWLDLAGHEIYENESIFSVLQRLLKATLDPCLCITDDIESLDDLSVSKASVLSKIPKIYYGEDDITSSLSPIITNMNYHPSLYSLSSSIIDVLHSASSVSLYNLLYSALYISELVRISLSIPGESRLKLFDGFDIYSGRIQNEDVSVSVIDISIFIPQDVITNDDNMDGLFDSNDVLIVGVDTSTSNEVQTDNNVRSKCKKRTGTLSNNSVSITISNATVLTSNISFTFKCGDTGCDDEFECVWYNETNDIWSTTGCVASIDTEHGEITCLCNHMTTFATVHNLHSSECDDNSYIKEWLSSEEWDYINMVIASLFTFSFIYSLYFVYPFCRNRQKITWKKHRGVIAVLLMGITAFLYILVCAQAYWTKTHFTKTNIRIYSFVLLLPQNSFFMAFSMVFYTWYCIINGLNADFRKLKKRVLRILFVSNVILWVILIGFYVTTIVLESTNIMRMFEYLWSFMLSFITICICIFAFKSGRVLYHTYKLTQNQRFAETSWRQCQRLLRFNATICLYFVGQTAANIVTSMNVDELSIYDSIVILFIDALYVLMILIMYSRSARQSIHEMNEMSTVAMVSSPSGVRGKTAKHAQLHSASSSGSPGNVELSTTPAGGVDATQTRTDIDFATLPPTQLQPVHSISSGNEMSGTATASMGRSHGTRRYRSRGTDFDFA